MQKFQEELEEKKRRNEFFSDSVDLLYYELHIISLNRGGSYIDSPEWLKKKKETINPKNDDDKCFQYALSVALNHEQMKKDHNVTFIQTASLFILKLKMLMKILQMMLKNGLTHQVMKLINHFHDVRPKK